MQFMNCLTQLWIRLEEACIEEACIGEACIGEACIGEACIASSGIASSGIALHPRVDCLANEGRRGFARQASNVYLVKILETQFFAFLAFWDIVQ